MQPTQESECAELVPPKNVGVRLCGLQEAGDAALLCLACEGEAKSAPRRILVVRIAEAQQPEQQPLQVRQQRLGLVGRTDRPGT